MPRLFPSLGRSSKDRGAYGQYEGYDAPYGYDHGYQEQEPRHNRSAWSKVLSRKSTKRVCADTFQSQGMHNPMGGYRTTVEDYPEDPRTLVPGMPTDETQSFEELLSGRHSDTAIPLVQRESSLSRIQHAFADNGTYAPALSAAPSASHGHGYGAPFYAPQPIPAMSPHQRQQLHQREHEPHLSAVHDLHQPAMVMNNTVPMQGVRADIVHHSASYPSHERDHRRHRERERSAPPRSYRDHPAYWEEPLESSEEPPVVVVVEHGKNGKKDKYYIIPGGAPVIFEDEDGNELTRVGDFSGRYKPPRRPRPVIVQDQYGREICRAGFSHDDHISVGSRSNGDRSPRSGGSSRSDHRGRSIHRSHDQRVDATRHAGSSHSSRAFAHDSYHNDPHYQYVALGSSRPRAGTSSSRDGPEVYYVDPRKDRSGRSGYVLRSESSSDTLVRASPRDHHSGSGRSHRTREYDSDSRERERGREYYQRDHQSSRRR
ncbi:hypothetical protein BV20DRAFT_952253 [Pilatotrama ljubarskyi]|nr:hypothetical protein BV20DRAFT_952253 [Pilatotrama ljubarskyi]